MTQPGTRLIEELLAIQDIKRLKARYFRALDTKDWDLLASLFTDTATFEFPGLGSFDDPGSFLTTLKETMAGMQTVHHGHMPEIEILGPDRASGVWAMYDRVTSSRSQGLPGYEAGIGPSFEGFGHYREQYLKVADSWKIDRLQLTRLQVVPLSAAGTRP